MKKQNSFKDTIHGRTNMWRLLYVLSGIDVTAIVFHLERSELKREADWNAVKVTIKKYG